MQASGSLLSQLRPANINAASAFTASVPTEVTAIYVANTTGAAVSCRIFHDDDGSTFNQDTALYYDVSVPANETLVLLSAVINGGISVQPGGQIGVRSASGNALNFSIYGITFSATGDTMGVT